MMRVVVVVVVVVGRRGGWFMNFILILKWFSSLEEFSSYMNAAVMPI
jgi:hypothetical protein